MNELKIIVYTLFDEKYYGLANITAPNKMEYCEKHGYEFKYRADKFFYTHIGFEKIHRVLEIFEKEECDILYWCGADTLITNMNIKITDLMDKEHDFFICGDANGINADSFIIKNTPIAKQLFQDVLDFQLNNNYKYEKENLYLNEQETLVEFIKERYASITKICPQRHMNSYNYDLYPTHHFGEQFASKKDYLGNDGNWQPGDFLIHFPGQSLEGKITYSNHYLTLVQK
jgi:mannan polymerase II complex MNN10 subunit